MYERERRRKKERERESERAAREQDDGEATSGRMADGEKAKGLAEQAATLKWIVDGR